MKARKPPGWDNAATKFLKRCGEMIVIGLEWAVVPTVLYEAIT